MSSPPAGSGRPMLTSPPTAWRRRSVCRSTAIRAPRHRAGMGENDRRRGMRVRRRRASFMSRTTAHGCTANMATPRINSATTTQMMKNYSRFSSWPLRRRH